LETNNNIVSNYESLREVSLPETSKLNILGEKKYNFINLDKNFDLFTLDKSKTNLDKPDYRKSIILDAIKQKHNEDNILELKQSKETIEKLYFELDSLRQEV
jgi:hypothetical protein